MGWLAKAAIGMAGLVGGIAALGFLLPDDLHVERRIVIDAPQQEVFGLVADFRNWPKWSPWAEMDPAATYAFSGSGLGQTMQWHSSHPAVGVGRNEITHHEPDSEMRFHIELGKDGRGDGRFVLSRVEGGIEVAWSVTANLRDGQPWFRRPQATFMQYVIDLDAAIGGEYAMGLRNLKEVAEAP